MEPSRHLNLGELVSAKETPPTPPQRGGGGENPPPPQGTRHVPGRVRRHSRNSEALPLATRTRSPAPLEAPHVQGAPHHPPDRPRRPSAPRCKREPARKGESWQPPRSRSWSLSPTTTSSRRATGSDCPTRTTRTTSVARSGSATG